MAERLITFHLALSCESHEGWCRQMKLRRLRSHHPPLLLLLLLLLPPHWFYSCQPALSWDRRQCLISWADFHDEDLSRSRYTTEQTLPFINFKSPDQPRLIQQSREFDDPAVRTSFNMIQRVVFVVSVQILMLDQVPSKSSRVLNLFPRNRRKISIKFQWDLLIFKTKLFLQQKKKEIVSFSKMFHITENKVW